MSPIEPLIPDFGAVAASWQKWEEWLRPCYDSMNQTLLHVAGIQAGDHALDVGCGSGYFAQLEARQAGKDGRVTGIDISNEMVEMARRNAIKNGITNVHFEQQDTESLRFTGDSFDAVTARFSLMFLKSPSNGLCEIRRVLKPGGTFAASVWGEPKKNPLPSTILKRFAHLPEIRPEIPGPFRFSRPGILSEMLRKTGFEKTLEQEIFIKELFDDSRQYVTHLLESSGTWRSLLMSLPERQFVEVMQALTEAAEQYRNGDHVEIPRSAFIVSGC